MNINDKVQVNLIKTKNVVKITFDNAGSEGTIFGNKDPIVDQLEKLDVRLSLSTAKKLGEALIKLSKGS
jgi:hypothetical protein